MGSIYRMVVMNMYDTETELGLGSILSANCKAYSMHKLHAIYLTGNGPAEAIFVCSLFLLFRCGVLTSQHVSLCPLDLHKISNVINGINVDVNSRER